MLTQMTDAALREMAQDISAALIRHIEDNEELRDRFAMHASTGLSFNLHLSAEGIAKEAYAIADAMLEARNK